MAEKIEFNLAVPKNDLDKALDQGIKKTEQLESTLSTALAVFGGNLITKGFDALVGGLNDIIGLGKEAVSEAAAQEVATNNLNNALARRGNYTKEASDAMLAFADTMQLTTKYEDDAILANAALLESLTGLSSEGLKNGITAASDFATVLGIDLESATRLVGKAAEGNVEAFKRYGVEIKKGSSDAETFKNTLTELNKQFGGAAQSQLNTFSGSLTAAQNSFKNLLGTLGQVIVNNPIVIGLFNAIKDTLGELNGEAGGTVDALKDLIKDGILGAAVGAQLLLDVFSQITIAMKGAVNVFQIVGGQILISLVDPIEALIDGIIFLGSKIPGIGDEFKGLENPLKSATDALRNFTQDGIQGLSKIDEGNVFSKLSGGIETFTTKMLDSAYEAEQAALKTKNAKNGTLDNENDVNAQILASRQTLINDIKILEEQNRIEQDALTAQLDALSLESEAARDQAKIDAVYNQKIAEAQATYEGELLKNKAIADAEQMKLANQKAFETLSLASQKAFSQREIDQKIKANKDKDDLSKQELKDKENFYSAATSLQNSNNKTLAAVGKAFAIQQATMQGYQAIQSSYNYGALLGGPPVAALFAGIAAAATAANVAKIAGVQFENGGFINGSNGATMGPDNTIASVRSGEMVLNASQQKTLFDAINNGGLGGGQIVVQIDGREVFYAVRRQIEGGARLYV